MIRTMVPAAIGLIAIIGLSLYENVAIKDRWAEPEALAEEMGKRFKQVPHEIGNWIGEDLPVE